MFVIDADSRLIGPIEGLDRHGPMREFRLRSGLCEQMFLTPKISRFDADAALLG